MQVLDSLAAGFAVALSPQALLFCFIGATVGTVIGVLPGIGALATISILLPYTFHLDPTIGLIMLAGIFYGAQYGGSTASILLNLPGTASTAVTALDGHPMAKSGKAGVALFVTTVTSFVGGSIAIGTMILLAPYVASIALRFGSAEYFSVMLLSLVAAATLSPGSMFKGLAMVVFGLILGTVGADAMTGFYRLTFGFLELVDGINLIAVVMGLFGVAEVLSNLVGGSPVRQPAEKVTLRSMVPSRDEARRSVAPTFRGAAVGIVTGILPGVGPQVASFVAYALEKRISKQPERFGSGMIEGIASPEASNNASVQAAFIPTLTLGIPGDAVMAVIASALMLHGILPGPRLVVDQPDLFWGLIASFWIGNVILLFLNIPLIGLWIQILRVPYRLLYPAILALVCVGIYSIRNSLFDVMLVIVFGLLGLGMQLLRLPSAPLLLGLVLGPLLEEHLRRAMIISRGDPTTLLESPVSLVALALTVALLFSMVVSPLLRRAR